MFYTIEQTTTSEGISTLACADEAHLAAFSEQDEEYSMGLLGFSRNIYHMAEVLDLMWTLHVRSWHYDC